MIKFILHLRPKRIPEEALKFNVSYGLGGILTFLFFIEILTGILLMFYYSPSVNRAYFDVLKINNILPYGYILRNIHRFSGEFMIIIGFLHMCRVVFSEAIDTDVRKKNWIWGVFLFLLIFPLNFTGYLLPFDTISYWGATIVLNAVSEIPLIGKFLRYLISGSYGIDENVLLRFYVYHIVLLPLIFTLIMFVHFYKVRIAGGVKVRNFTKKVNISKLFKIEICTGPSAQSTLLGKSEYTYESLYLSRELLNKLEEPIEIIVKRFTSHKTVQLKMLVGDK